MSSGNAPIYLNEDNEDDEGLMGPSDSDDDDDEERLDCVHDIHGDGEEADVEEFAYPTLKLNSKPRRKNQIRSTKSRSPRIDERHTDAIREE